MANIAKTLKYEMKYKYGLVKPLLRKAANDMCGPMFLPPPPSMPNMDYKNHMDMMNSKVYHQELKNKNKYEVIVKEKKSIKKKPGLFSNLMWWKRKV